MTGRASWFAEHILPQVPKVRAWLRRAGWNADEIDDIVQESYARLASCAYEQIVNPGPFFFQTARNVAASLVRRRSIVSIRSVADIEQFAFPDPAPNAEEQLSAHEELERLKSAIESLPDFCRRSFVLRKIDGVSQAETARLLGLSESAVEKHVARGLRHCAAMLAGPIADGGIPNLLSLALRKAGIRRGQG